MNLFEFQRMNRLPPYVFATVIESKMTARRAGEDIIDLGMGNPDLGTPRHIVDKLIEAAAKESNHRYSASRGITKLRHAISDWYERRFGVDIDPDNEAVVTLGAKEGLAHLTLATITLGEVVLAPDPTYPIHSYAAIIAGGDLRSVPIGPDRDFFIDLQIAVRQTWPRPRMLVISFPHNPTGTVVELDFFEKVVDFCKENKILVVHDLAYADLCFDGYQAPSLLAVKGAKEIGVEVFSLSKSYSMAGWRIGFLCGNREMVGALTRLKSYLDYGAFQPIQIAAIIALNSNQDCVTEIAGIYKERRDVLVEGLEKAGWSVPSPKGGMFIWAKIPERFQRLGSVDFTKMLIREAKVAVSPGLGFGSGGEGYVRFALVENIQRIQQAVRSLKKVLST
ncbi:MAG: glutamate-pyruvate aminotransferase [Candidatus Adiutrix intracellularis]|jgi:alanine-synthesizing transaminase|nr:MAG: glutamate-pyruvate aminotransferase [Candidatus Adiutrix intracellularis]MDR2827622.1 aminotransferase class I/II-fold pyridoxal phosphate-dependent enzyme [Candidatus Adiutrix intracellularis]